MSSFNHQKDLLFEITLSNGSFSNEQNSVSIRGLRATVIIEHAGLQQLGSCRAKIYGVKKEDTDLITTVMYDPVVYSAGTLIKNQLVVHAIDGNEDTVIFSGMIVNAWGDYNDLPNAFLHIQASQTAFYQLQPVTPVTYRGPVETQNIYAELADRMQLNFENNGVNSILFDTYLCGSLMDQVFSLRSKSGTEIFLDTDTIAITNRGSARIGDVISIDRNTGLVGYPTFDGVSVNFQLFFNPQIMAGKKIQLTTDIPRANGAWYIFTLTHYLESVTQNGKWISYVRGLKERQ